MNILASLGTMDMPFTRMAQAVDQWAGQHSEATVTVQTGHTPYRYQHCHSFAFCTKEEMKSHIQEADILILQGGWGAISEAMEMGKRMVVMPRHDKTEHIHDQFQLVRKLDSLGCVIGVFDEKQLGKCMEKALTHPFQTLPKGNAETIIREKLKEWMGN